MSENFYESEVRRVLEKDFSSGALQIIGESSEIFKMLAISYPAIGSKIDWSEVPGAILAFEENDSLQVEKFIGFFDEIVAKYSLVGDVVYVGDSATDFSLKASVEKIRQILPELLDIPQHHYFVGSDFSWCMCLTMEGDMGFGFGGVRKFTQK
ncbi:hypothetical protein [Burkholderia ubonensis]|uniref:hypothetical protein n=1 Tax=Burkholderia ubonensis TaxID=101571 RepID=UPI000A7398FB|nr:hypothetical protein [Burkholderia ubonensis]